MVLTVGMGTSAAYQRALLLLQQNRPADAERELRHVLVFDPQHAMAHMMLARCLVEQERLDEAQQHAMEGVRLAPDEPMSHYTMSLVLFSRNRFPEAEAAIRQAIGLDPNDADLMAMLAQVLIQQRRWEDALAAAERGLAIDPEHVGCTNLRAIALVHLGRTEQAGQTIDAALRRDPDNSLSHANQGWTLLHQGEPLKAMEHFREALRLQPDNEWARAGIVEALKAKHLVYRVMLKYFLAMSRLSATAQWIIVLGLWVLSRVLDGVANSYPAVAPFVRPIVYAYLVFVVMTWLSPHLFNLLLRLNRFGRHALSDEQRRASNLLGGMIVTAGIILLGAWGTWDANLLVLGMCALALLLPMAGAYHAPAGWPRWVMFALTVVLAVLALGMYALAAGEETLSPAKGGLWQAMMWIFAIGVVASQILANLLAAQHVRR